MTSPRTLAAYRRDTTHDIELRFSPDAADAVLETTWHHTQQSRQEADGSVTLAFRIDGLNEIVRWVLGWAGRVRVVQPAELRELVPPPRLIDRVGVQRGCTRDGPTGHPAYNIPLTTIPNTSPFLFLAS